MSSTWSFVIPVLWSTKFSVSKLSNSFSGLGLEVAVAVAVAAVLTGTLALLLTREMEPFPAAIDLKLSRGEFSLCLGIRIKLVLTLILCSQGVVLCSGSDFSLQVDSLSEPERKGAWLSILCGLLGKRSS